MGTQELFHFFLQESFKYFTVFTEGSQLCMSVTLTTTPPRFQGPSFYDANILAATFG